MAFPWFDVNLKLYRIHPPFRPKMDGSCRSVRIDQRFSTYKFMGHPSLEGKYTTSVNLPHMGALEILPRDPGMVP